LAYVYLGRAIIANKKLGKIGVSITFGVFLFSLYPTIKNNVSYPLSIQHHARKADSYLQNISETVTAIRLHAELTQTEVKIAARAQDSFLIESSSGLRVLYGSLRGRITPAGEGRTFYPKEWGLAANTVMSPASDIEETIGLIRQYDLTYIVANYKSEAEDKFSAYPQYFSRLSTRSPQQAYFFNGEIEPLMQERQQQIELAIKSGEATTALWELWRLQRLLTYRETQQVTFIEIQREVFSLVKSREDELANSLEADFSPSLQMHLALKEIQRLKRLLGYRVDGSDRGADQLANTEGFNVVPIDPQALVYQFSVPPSHYEEARDNGRLIDGKNSTEDNIFFDWKYLNKAYIEFELAQSRFIDRVVVYGNPPFKNYVLKEIALEASRNGEAWLLIEERKDPNGYEEPIMKGPQQAFSLTFNVGLHAKKVRIRLEGIGHRGHTTLGDVQFFTLEGT